MKCFGCSRELEPGDEYIEDAASRFVGGAAESTFDGLIAKVMCDADNVIFCTDCTVPGGEYETRTFWGDDDGEEV
jgi:hypothetical protein